MHRCLRGLIGLALVAAALALVPTSAASAEELPNPLCQPGSYSATGFAPCTAAPLGSFVDTTGAVAATLCSVGKYQDAEGQTSCKDAPAGFFVDVEGAVVATQCAPGSYQPAAGSDSCLLAEPGSFVSSAGAIAPTLCPVGRYQNLEGQVLCVFADPGFYVDTTGAASATPCPVGTFQDLAGQSSCTPAPAGTYVDTLGAIAATNCPSGTDSPAGSDGIEDCVAVILDADGDGVPDGDDQCAGTDLGAPGAPRTWLRSLLWSNGDGDFVDRDGRLSGITVTQTHGCSATQIVADLEGGNLLERIVAAASKRYGFGRTTLLLWIATN